MQVLLPLLLVGFQTPSVEGSVERATIRWRAPGIFDPSLQACSKLRRTRGSLCAIGADAAYWLSDEGSAFATELHREEPGWTLLDATSWDEHSAEVWGDLDGQLHVWADLGDGQLMRPIPPEYQRGRRPGFAASAAIAARGSTIVVYVSGSLLRLERGSWSRVHLDAGEQTLVTPARCALLVGRELFLALDSWAGELVVADIDNGKMSWASEKFPEGANLVRDLDLGPDGRVYVTCSAGILSTGGQVLVRDGTSWRVLLSSPVQSRPWVCGEAPPDFYEPRGEPSQSYLALAFDRQKRLCLLTDQDGVLRRDVDGRWNCITPGWGVPWFTVNDLALTDNAAVFASTRLGALTVNLSTLEGQRMHAP